MGTADKAQRVESSAFQGAYIGGLLTAMAFVWLAKLDKEREIHVYRTVSSRLDRLAHNMVALMGRMERRRPTPGARAPSTAV